MKKDVLIKIAIDKWVTTEDIQLEKNGPYYNLSKIKNYTKKLNPISVNIDDITNLSRSKKSGFSKKRYTNSDLNVPIIINENKRIIDGRHRTLKAKDLHEKKIKAYMVKDEIIKSLIK